MNRFSHIISLPASIVEIYSASIVKRATHFRNFNNHDIAPLEDVNRYPVVDYNYQDHLPYQHPFSPSRLDQIFQSTNNLLRYLLGT